MFSSFSEKYLWTIHARVKMKYYGVAESKVRRIIRFPVRYEEGIVENTVAVMCPAGTKRYSEIWVMYKLVSDRQQANPKCKYLNPKQAPITKIQNSKLKKIKIITVWRYPGKAPTRDPIPGSVLEEIDKLL